MKEMDQKTYSVPMENFSSTVKLADDKSIGRGGKGEDDDDYDPFAHRKVEHPNSDLGALAHLLKSSLGSGILAMPLAFKNGGLAFGMVGTLVVGFICTHCVQMLVECSHILCRRSKVPFLSFADTAEVAFSTGPKQVQRFSRFASGCANCMLSLTYLGACVVYSIFMAVNIRQVIEHYADIELDIRLYILMLWVPLMVLCLVRELKYLVPFSVVANLLIVVSFAITLYYMFNEIHDPSERKLIAEVDKMPLFFSTVIFAMEGIGVVMPVENSMKNPRHFLGCPGVLNIAMCVVVLLYAIIGFFGYLRYGDLTEGTITLNLPIEEGLAQAVKILIALAIFFTYALQFYVPTSIIWELVQHRVPPEKRNFYNYVMRMIIVAGTVVLAIAVPNLGPIISLVGAVCFSVLGLLLPAAIELCTKWENDLGFGNWVAYKDIVIMILAIFALVAGSYTSILEIIEAYK